LPSREFYLNADFDASLRGRASLLDSADPTYLHEMAWHFLFAAGPQDSLIVHRDLPGDFTAYLSAKGMPAPRTIAHPYFTPGSRFTPFGWNAHTEELAARYSDTAPHPDPRIIRIANSRAFSLEVEREWSGGGNDGDMGIRGNLFVAPEDLESFLASRAEPAGWVVKGDHGHAGTANRRVPSGPLSETDRAALAQLFREHGRAVAEPWQERLMDMSVNFTVGRSGGGAGAVSDFRGHALLNSRDGAFLGVKILPDRRPPAPWGDVLEASAAELAKALDALGYFGPVGVDAYVWNSPEGPRLRPVVDINARLSMALPAHGLADRLPGKTLLWIWSKPRKLALPSDYSGLDKALGEHAFDPETRRGILAVSPLARNPGREGGGRPRRIAFLFSAEGEEDLARLQAGFSRALGRS
jgi:hypothetical protein